MSSVRTLLGAFPLCRLEPHLVAGGSRLCPASSVVYIQTRGRIIYHYKNKCKRMKEESKSVANLKWAQPILEMATKREPLAEEREPHMLHLVTLKKTTNCRPWWEKDIIEKLGLKGKLNQPVILKNVPSINKLLFEVKHLVKILPLKFPHGLPEDESELEHALIKSNGEMVIVKRLKEYEPEKTELEKTAEASPSPDVWSLSWEAVQGDLAKKLLDYSVHTEYHRAKYTYHRNEDGKEYRYNFNKDVPDYER